MERDLIQQGVTETPVSDLDDFYDGENVWEVTDGEAEIIFRKFHPAPGRESYMLDVSGDLDEIIRVIGEFRQVLGKPLFLSPSSASSVRVFWRCPFNLN